MRMPGHMQTRLIVELLMDHESAVLFTELLQPLSCSARHLNCCLSFQGHALCRSNCFFSTAGILGSLEEKRCICLEPDRCGSIVSNTIVPFDSVHNFSTPTRLSGARPSLKGVFPFSSNLAEEKHFRLCKASRPAIPWQQCAALRPEMCSDRIYWRVVSAWLLLVALQLPGAQQPHVYHKSTISLPYVYHKSTRSLP